MTLDAIVEELAKLAASPKIFDEDNLAARVEALDDLDFAEVIIVAHLRAHPSDTAARRLRRQAVDLHDRLGDLNHHFFERYRAQIRAHTISPLDLRHLFDRYTGYAPSRQAYRHLGFEALDRLVAGLLLREEAPEPREHESPEMVAYQPTPASIVLELVDTLSLGPRDVFFDIGSGLGQVVHLVSLLTGVRTTGIEVDPGLCSYAATIIQDLDLRDVTFVNADARDADYADGTVFYLFTPFTGTILTDVLARLRRQTGDRRIRVCGYGPITPHLAREPWLADLNDHRGDEFRLALFQSRP